MSMMHPFIAASVTETVVPAGYALLSPVQIGLVRATFQILAADGHRLAEMFYARIATLDPQLLRPKFVVDMTSQRQQLLLALNAVVQQLDDPPRLAQTIGAFTRRNGIYGASAPRFHAVRAALAWTIGRILETGWNSPTQAAWNAALDLMEALLSGGIPAER